MSHAPSISTDYHSIGEATRKLFGEPFYPVERTAKLQEPWYCNSGGCKRWRDASGEYRGDCVGYCFAY